jgi:hypothetical protein
VDLRRISLYRRVGSNLNDLSITLRGRKISHENVKVLIFLVRKIKGLDKAYFVGLKL